MPIMSTSMIDPEQICKLINTEGQIITLEATEMQFSKAIWGGGVSEADVMSCWLCRFFSSFDGRRRRGGSFVALTGSKFPPDIVGLIIATLESGGDAALPASYEVYKRTHPGVSEFSYNNGVRAYDSLRAAAGVDLIQEMYLAVYPKRGSYS